MGKIKILIADDHPLIREGLGKVLQLDPDLELIGEAINGEDALNKTETFEPNIILMDINMPVINGIEATRKIKENYPDVKVIALTAHDNEEQVIEVIKAGVSGYILKDVSPDVLITTIRAVVAGETVIHPDITAKLMKQLSREPSDSENPHLEEELTSREIEILRLIAQGIGNKDIARQLYISEKTVKNHITNIFRKIKVCDRTQAALYAIKSKLVDF